MIGGESSSRPDREVVRVISKTKRETLVVKADCSQMNILAVAHSLWSLSYIARKQDKKEIVEATVSV